MTIQKSKKKTFKGMGYRIVQAANSNNRKKLHQDDLIYLKDNNYKNLGWDNIISLYQKIEGFLDKYKYKDWTLEELFLESDRIGNKYLTSQEIAEFNQKMSQEVNEVAEEIDKHFLDREMEIIDFSANKNRSRKQTKTRSRKTMQRR